MTKISTLIVDDEAHNLTVLKTLVGKYCPQLHIDAEAISADEAYEKIVQLNPQLVLLDVKMPHKSGFDLLRMFKSIDFEIIFVSAFSEYAISAFDFNALAYILKPIDYQKLILAVQKAAAKIEEKRLGQKENKEIVYFIRSLEEENDIVNKINIHSGSKVVLLNIRDIVMIQADESSTELLLVNGQKYASGKRIKEFEDLLASHHHFFRISKSILVNLDLLTSYSKGEICIL